MESVEREIHKWCRRKRPRYDAEGSAAVAAAVAVVTVAVEAASWWQITTDSGQTSLQVNDRLQYTDTGWLISSSATAWHAYWIDKASKLQAAATNLMYTTLHIIISTHC